MIASMMARLLGRRTTRLRGRSAFEGCGGSVVRKPRVR
jgi:hypothetical protein